MKKYISIIDDESEVLELVSYNLKNNNYETGEFLNGKSFYDSIKRRMPDLIILDLILPDINGIDICKKIKSEKSLKKIPVIMLTARGDTEDRIKGLESGADDYITKPFSIRELITRVKAVLRRYEIDSSSSNDKKNILEIDNSIFIDQGRHEIYDENKNSIRLTIMEFNILVFLVKKRGFVVSRDDILNNAGDKDKVVIDRTVDVHIKNLKGKLGNKGKLIKNIRGIGYKLELKEKI
jgi:DNA-binding response OmpR family regulator